MAFEKKYNDCKILFLVLIGIPLIASTNIDCGGKSFHCVNSTHFMICVDLGGGVSTTVDDLVISCPPSTLCQGTNRFECEFPVKTTPLPPTQVTEVTNEISTTPQWEEIVVTTMFPKNASKEQLDLKYTDGTNLTTVADVTSDVPIQNTSSLNVKETGKENNLATSESTYKSTVYTEANNVNVTIANANETIINLENNQTDTHIIGTDFNSGLVAIDTKTSAVSETTDNPISATNFTDADNNINSTEKVVTLNTIIVATTMANKTSLLNNNSRDNVNATNLIEDIYFTTSIPDLVTATTIEEKITQSEMLTPSILDGVQTSTDTITTVSAYSIGLVNISERVDNKTGPMKESGMENIVTTTTATLIFKPSSHSTSSNPINETAINTGSEANETYKSTVSANTPGIYDVTDPPTSEVIMTNTEKYVNSNNNIPEIATNTIATNIDNTSDMLHSGVTTTEMLYTTGEMVAVENILLNGSAIAAGDGSLTTKKTNNEIVTANPIIEGFISNTTEIPTNSGLPRSEIVSFVSTTIPSDTTINISSVTSIPQMINFNETTVTTENVIAQTEKTTIQQPVTNIGNKSTMEKNLTDSKNISEAQSTSQVTSMWSSTDVTNSTDKETAITSFLSNNQSVTEAPAIIITDFQVTASIDIKQNQSINHDLDKTQNETQKTKKVQSSLTNSETHKASWSSSTIVESSTTATTATNGIYLHELEHKQIEENTTTINANVNILEDLTTTNPTDVVSRTTATAKEIEYTQDPNTSPKLEGSVKEPTKVNIESILQPTDNNEANNFIQTISTKMVSEENLTTTSRTFVTMTEFNQGNTSTTASSASPKNYLETVSTTLPSPASVLRITSGSNFTNGTDVEITSTITPLNTISTEIDNTVTVTNVKTEPKVDNPLQNVIINIDFSTEIPPARDVPFQTQNTFTATNNAFGKTTESYIEDNQNVTTQDTMIILTITSDGVASYSPKTNALHDPKQIVQGVTTEPFDGIRNPAVKEDGIVTPVTQTESSYTSDQQNTFLNTQAQIGSATTNGPLGGLVNSQAQTSSSPMNGQQDSLVSSQPPAETLLTTEQLYSLVDSEAQTGSSTTNGPQGGVVNSQAQTGSSSTDGPQGDLLHSNATTDSSLANGTQGGFVNGQVQTESSLTNGTQGGLAYSQGQTASSSTISPQGGLVNSQATTGNSLENGPQCGLVNSQATTESTLANGPQGGFINGQVETESSLANGPQGGLGYSQAQTASSSTISPQGGLVNSQATTGSSLMNGSQGGFVNGQLQTDNSLTNGPQGGLAYSQAQTESSSTIGTQGGLGNSQAMTGSLENGLQVGLVNSQATTESPATIGPQGGLVNSQATTGSSLINGPQSGLVNSQQTTESSAMLGPQDGLVNSQATTGSSLINGPHSGLVNSQATTESSLANGSQGGFINGQVETGSSLTSGPQGVLAYSQAQTESSATIGPQGSLVNSQAMTGSSLENDPQGSLVNSQAQTASSATIGPQSGLVNSQATIGSLLMNDPQGGLGYSQTQTASSSTIGPQGGLVNSQATTESSLTNGPQGVLAYSQAQTESSSTIGSQGSLVNSQAMTGSSLENDPQGGLVKSQATKGISLANVSQGGFVNSQTHTGTSFTPDQTHSLVNSQVQTGSSSTNGLQGGLINSQVQIGSSWATDQPNSSVDSQTHTGTSFTTDQLHSLVNSEVQTGSSSTNGPQTGIVDSQSQTISTTTNGQQKGFINSQATTGSFSTNGQQEGFVNSQIQTGSSFTTDQTHSFVDSQAQTVSLTTNSPQIGLLNSPAQIASKGTSNQQNGLVNSQAQTASLMKNAQQNELVISQTQTAKPLMNGQQYNVVNSQVQVGSTSINISEKGLVNSQAQTASSTTNGLVNNKVQAASSTANNQQNGVVNSQVKATNSTTTGQQNSLVNSQAQTTSSTANDQENGVLNSLVLSTMASAQLNSHVQATSTVTNGQPNSLVNNQGQVRSTTVDSHQNGVVNIEVQTTGTLINGQQNNLVTSQVQATKTLINGQQNGLVNSHTQAVSALTNGKQNGLVNNSPGFTLNETLTEEDNKTSTDSNKMTSTFHNATYNSLGIVPAYPDSSVDKNNETLYLHAQTETNISEQSRLENTSSTNNAVIQPVTAIPLFEGKRQIASNANVGEVTVSSIYVSTIKLLSTGGVHNKAPLKTTNLPLAYNQHVTAGEFRTPYAATTVLESSLRENPIIYTTAGSLPNAKKDSSSQSITESPMENYEPVTGKHFPVYQDGKQYGGKVEIGTQGGLNKANDQVETTTESMKSTVEENAKRSSISIAITPALKIPTPGGNLTIIAIGNSTQITPVNSGTTVSLTQKTRNGDVDKFNKTPEVIQTSYQSSATGVVMKGNSGVSHVEATNKSLNVDTVINTDQKMPQDSLTNLHAVDSINQESKVQQKIIPDLIQRVTDSQNIGQLSHATTSISVENTTKRLVTLQTEVTTSRTVAKTSVNQNDPIVTQQTTRHLTTSTVKPTTSTKPRAPTSSVKPILNSDTVTNGNQKGAAKKPIFTCKDRIRGRYSDPDDCRKFYICSGLQEPIIGLCPVNTVFSEIKTQCTKNLSHCIRNNQFKCVSKGRFSDYLQQNIYYICVQNTLHNFIRFKFQCQMGYYLNKTTVRCLKIPEVVNLSSSFDNISKSTVETISNEDKKSKEKTKSKKGDDFECEKQGKFPDENNCRRYYVCSKSKRSEEFRRRMKKCDSDEVFHKDKKKCVDAESYEC